MIKIEITGESPELVKLEMLRLCGVKIPASIQAAVASTVPAPTTADVTPVEPAELAQPTAEPAPKLTAAQKRAAKKAEEAAANERRLDASPSIQPEAEATEEAPEEAAPQEAPPALLTHDTVRAELGKYVKQYGMTAAQEDGPKVLAKVLGAGKSKVSDIPDDQALLGKVIAGIGEMLQKNPFNRPLSQ